MNLKQLNDLELINSAKNLVGEERNTVADFLLNLIEIEQRGLYLNHGYSSMFDYLTQGLKFSEPAAARRLRAARCLSENPKAEPMLRNGELNLTTLCQASSVVKDENVGIEQFRGVSSRKAELIAAEYKSAPKKKIKDTIKPIGRRKNDSEELPLLSSTVGADSSGNKNLVSLKHEVRFEVGVEFTEKLEEVRIMLSNKLGPGASLEEVLGVCMEVCLEKNCPKRKEARRKKRKVKESFRTRTKNTTRYIPAAVRAGVMQRDKYQCSFVGADGKRCGCRETLQIDHIVPFSVGGGSESENLRVLCKGHNLFEARQVFGSSIVQRCIDRSKTA